MNKSSLRYSFILHRRFNQGLTSLHYLLNIFFAAVLIVLCPSLLLNRKSHTVQVQQVHSLRASRASLNNSAMVDFVIKKS